MFLNFPIADMNRNVFWRHAEGVAKADIARMTAFWGDESWRTAAYRKEMGLFDDIEEKNDNETIVRAFKERLHDVAHFDNVPEPIPMRNTTGATVYYLFFASHKPVAQNIVTALFTKYRNRGAI
jgi:three-Cys-motif partner protein